MTPFINTADDALENLESFVTSRPVGPSVSQYTIRSALEKALREIASLRDWVTMKRLWRIPLVATQIGGMAGDNTNGSTLSYQAAPQVIGGVTYQYVATLSGATWPAWASGAELRIGDGFTNCDIDQVITATQATLKSPRIPVADATSDSYMIGRSWYALPPDAIAFWSALGHNAWFIQGFISFDEWHALNKYRATTGMVRKVSVGPAPTLMGQLALYVFPWSLNSEEMDMVLKVRARPIRYWGRDDACSQGGIYGTAGSTAVTGIGTAFTAGMVGASIRLSTSATLPTGTAGGSLGSNPYAEQHTIVSVSSGTALFLDTPLTASYGNGGESPTGYMIADWIDLDGAIYDAFVANAQRQLAHLAGFKLDEIKEIEAFYRTVLARARAADDRVRQRMVAGSDNNSYSRLRDYPNRPIVGGSVTL